jgi:diaminopimelate epimerase
VALYDKALSEGVAYVAGSFFHKDGSHRNTMRLNFSFIAEEKMEPGIRLLASLVTPAPTLYKFSGAGNDFVVLDGRKADVSAFRQTERISALCKEYRTDGLMILGQADGYDFAMEFYNPDGSGGMMCGNGGRCIVAFADYLGLKPASTDGIWHFLAPDGPHEAQILPFPVDMSPGGKVLRKWTVRLKMINVQGVDSVMGGYFLNTGTRHFVKFVADVDGLDVEKEGPVIRWDKAFQPEGTNANFVEVAADGLHVRTFEKGVEGETLACGTGLTASAIAAYAAGHAGVIPGSTDVIPGSTRNLFRLQCRRGDWLQVDFKAHGDRFTDVYLTGPAELIAYKTR